MPLFGAGMASLPKSAPMVEGIRPKSIFGYQIVRFAIIGGLTAAIYVATYTALASLGSVSDWISVVISYLVAITFQYVGHSMFTFRRPVQSQSQFLRFAVLNGAGLCFAIAITEIGTNVLEFQPLIAGIIVVAFLPIMNFVIMRIWVYA